VLSETLNTTARGLEVGNKTWTPRCWTSRCWTPRCWTPDVGPTDVGPTDVGPPPSDGLPWDPDGCHDVAWQRRRGKLKAGQRELNNRQQTESGPDLKAGQLELNNRQQTESGPVLKVV